MGYSRGLGRMLGFIDIGDNLAVVLDGVSTTQALLTIPRGCSGVGGILRDVFQWELANSKYECS